MKKIKKSMIILAVFFFAVCIPMYGQAASKSMKLSGNISSQTGVKLGWSKKSVSGYEIYRASCKKDEITLTSKYKKIATVSGKKTAYKDTVKAGKCYKYKIKAYKKKGKKKTYKYAGSCTVYTGIKQAEWDEYLTHDAAVTPESIQLIMYVPQGGINPSGFDIYRSIGSVAKKKIARAAAKNGSLEYVDKNVESGVTYTYQVRAYKKIGGKTIYGAYSIPVRLAAVNYRGKYKVQSFTENEKMVSSLVISITSDIYNANTIFSEADSFETIYEYTKQNETKTAYLIPKKYSYDNCTWHNLSEKETVLKPGKTLYLMFKAEDGKEFYYSASGVQSATLEYRNVGYKNLQSIMTVDLVKGTALVDEDGELYH